jgi:hypothetical protein
MKDFLLKKPTRNPQFSLTSVRADWKEINSRVVKFEPIEYNNIVIQDPYKFIEYQFELLEAKTNNEDYLPLFKRLSDLLFDIWVEAFF